MGGADGMAVAGRIEPLPLGADDSSDQTPIPEKLHKREREVNSLVAAFDRERQENTSLSISCADFGPPIRPIKSGETEHGTRCISPLIHEVCRISDLEQPRAGHCGVDAEAAPVVLRGGPKYTQVSRDLVGGALRSRTKPWAGNPRL